MLHVDYKTGFSSLFYPILWKGKQEAFFPSALFSDEIDEVEFDMARVAKPSSDIK